MNKIKLLLLMSFLALYGGFKGFANVIKPYNAILNVQKTVTLSFWLNPADLNFTENFETESGWTFTNGALPNKWMIGTGAFNGAGSTKALYVSNNNAANEYTFSTSSTTVHAVKQLPGTLPTDIGDVVVSFDWRCMGEGTDPFYYDYLRVWIVPSTFSPSYGVQITATQGKQFGGNLNLNGTWQTANIVANLSEYAGQSVKLVFEWRNDGSGGTNPPAAIDNVLVQGIVCSAPANLVLNGVTDTTMSYSWTPGATETSWEVIHQLSTAPAPTAATVGTVVTSPNYTTTTPLTPNTVYNFYVRAVCSGTEKSFWINLSNKRTSLVAIPMPWIENFEDGSSDFAFTEDTTVNKWHVGAATACSGTQSLYISNNNGVANAYTHASTTVHAYVDIAIPANATEATFSFDWKCVGEGATWDYFKVWMVSPSYQPVSGTLITAADSEGMQIGAVFNLQNACANYMQILNLAQYAGTSQRIVFEWRNDSTGGAQPPASIDNINFSMISCPRPIINEVIKNNAGQMVLSWTPQGTETAWELVIQPVNSGLPTGTSTIIPINGVPQYVFTPNPGEIYEFYVRAVCTTEDKSLWQGPETFSDFNPPACAEIDVLPLDLNLNQEGEYVICEGEDHVINLDASFDPSKFKSTTSYNIESIDYAPPFPFIGGTIMPITADDDYTASFTMPFDFCFFGKNYNYCRIGDNGVVTFGLPFTTTYGEYCPWDLNSLQIPNANFPIKNAIYGVYQDMLTDNNPGPNSQINYQVLGTYPCRALVVNFNEVPAFGDDDPDFRTTTQIVLYEITNIIEIYVKKRKADMSWPTGSDAGQGVLGIQNEAGTLAYAPPGRNTGSWNAEEEAWRFSPSGETNVTFGWYMDGELISNNPSHQVTINESHTFEARVTYPGCEGGDELVLSKSFTVKISEEIELGDPEDLIFCTDNMEDEDRPRITDNYEEIMSLITNKDEFFVTYHKALEEAEDEINPISNPEDYIPGSFPETIYVRVESKETECYEIVSFDVIEGEKPLELTQEDIIICNKYALPQLGAGQEYMYYDFVNFGTGSTTRVEKPAVGAMLSPGDYTVHVLSTSKDGCYEEFSFQIKVFPCIIPKGISPNGDGDNDYLDLADYMVQDIKIFNRYGKEVYSHGVGYKREWKGQDNNGNLLPTGTYYYNIITPFEQFTGYIYIMREVK